MKNSLPKGKYTKINRVSKITSLLVFLLLTVSSFSQTCNISQVNPCDTNPVLACTTGDGLYPNDPALSLHPAPGYFLSCSGGGTSGYQYENSFDIPESQSASGCWKYSGVQRIGNLGGVLNLFQSSGSEVSFTTPFFYMMPSDAVEMKLDVYRAGTSLFKINYYLENNLGIRTLQGTIDINDDHLSNTMVSYFPTITAPTTAPFRIYFELVASPAIPSGAKNRIDWLGINAPVYGTGCSGDANFSTTVTGLLPFFPVGSTPVTYTASYNNSAGTEIESKSCTYNVIVNKITLSGVPTSATCTTNGSIQIVAASANTSTNNLTYTINGGSPINLTGSLSTATTTAINEGVTTTTTYTTVTGTIPNLPAATYNIVVRDPTTNCSDSKEITVLKTADTEKPIITCPVAISKSTDVGICGASVSIINPTATDSCSSTFTFIGIRSDGLALSANYPIGVTSITWTATDAAGNISLSCDQTVTITDNEKPIIPTLADVTGQCSATATTPTTTDNCKGTVTGTTTDPLTYSTQGTHVITWTFNDGNGQSVSATQNVIVDDTVAPVIPILANVTGQCSATAKAPTTTDNCKGTVTGTTTDPLTYSTQGTHVINWTFDDGNGQSVSATQNVIVDDTVAPVIPILANVTGQCSATATAPATTDNCKGTVTGTTTDPLTYTTQGTHVINWTFDDGNGQSVSATQNVIVDDTITPVIPVLANVTGQCSATATAPTTTDNCKGTVTGTTTDPLTYSTQGTHVITWTFNDGNGQTVNATQNVIIDDTITPVIPVLANVTGQCSATATAPTTTDNCKGTVTGTTTDPLTYSTQGTHVINWTFDDGNGQSVSATQNVIVDDTVAPVIPILANVTGQCSATATAPTTTDNCKGTVTGTTTDPLTYSTQGTHVITWTFNDGNGQSVNATQNVIIDDTILPTAPILAHITGQCSATITAPTMMDNCNETLITGTTTDPLSFNAQGSYTITWTFDDGNGQSVTATQNVIIDDTVSPEIPTLADVTGQCSATASVPTTTDVCAGTLTGTTTDPLTYATQGTHVITWTFDDGNGQTVTAMQNVIVDDTENPVIPTLADVTGQCSTTATAPTTTDVCAGILTGTTTDPLTYSTQGTHVITWTFNDGNGQTVTAMQNVIIDDTIAPVIPVLGNVTGQCSATASVPTTTDVCAGTLTGTTTDLLTYATQGTHVITWTFDDGNGQTVTAMQNVIIDDTILPPAPILANVTGQCSATITAPTMMDNCNETLITGTTTDPLSYNAQGSYTITWTFDDGNGQSVTATQNVIIDDTVSPEIPTLADVTGQCSATASVPTTTDFCAGTLTGTTSDSLTYSTQGTHVITWTFDDGNGQTVTAMQNVIVDDTENPVIPTLADVTGQCSATASVPTTTDVCAGTLTGTTSDSLTYSTQGAHVITWTFDDGNGQTVTAMQNVIVDDTENPVIPVLANVTGQCSATASVPTTTDVCAGTLTGTTSDSLTYSTQGTHIITWTFSDGNGQTVTAMQNVIVKDSGAPTISAAGANATITCPATPTFTAPTSSDTCGTTTVNEISTITTPGICAGSYSVTRTWDATDANGNHSATVSQTIIVQDLIGPTTTTAFLASLDVLCDVIPAKPELVFVDNCSTVATPVYTEKIINQAPTSYSIEREWNVADACGNSSKFIQLVNVTIANAGLVINSSACNADSTPIDLNTLLPAGTPTNGVWTNMDNIGILQGSIFYPLDATLGDHIFEYKVTEGSCPVDLKINMNVNFDCQVLGCEAIVVHKAFTPNGDGINEQLVIDGVEDTICYPTGIAVEIYNRWGVLVFETTKYNNTTNAFEGYSKGRTTISQSDGLPTGTYFYIVNYESFDGTGNIQMNKKDGFLYLSR